MGLKYCNLPREVCHHLIGKDHTPRHRMIAGAGIMAVGVTLAQVVSELVHFPGAHFIFDMVGYGVHGLGLVPFIEHALD